jgi:DNA-binding transcriptional LysR family regulator
VAVAEELHFGRAAHRLNIAQPPLSQQIQQLERSVGTPLLKRTSRRTELTSAGAVFLGYARKLLASAALAADAALRAARGELETLQVGFTDSAALSVLPDMVRRFRRVRPDVHLELTEDSTQAQLAALEHALVDIALVRGPVSHASLRTRTLVSEEFVVALATDHPLAGRRSTVVRALAAEPFVLFPRELAPAFHDELIGMCRRAGFSPTIRALAGEYQTMLSLVAAGLGVSLVPSSVQNLGRAGVTYIALRGTRTRAKVVAAYRQDRESPIVRQFIASSSRLAHRSSSSSHPDRRFGPHGMGGARCRAAGRSIADPTSFASGPRQSPVTGTTFPRLPGY